MLKIGYPDIEARFSKPVGLKDITFTNANGATIRAARLDHPRAMADVYISIGQADYIENLYTLIRDLGDRRLNIHVLEREGETPTAPTSANPQMPSSVPHEQHIDDLHQFVTEVSPPQGDIPCILMGSCCGGLIGLRYLYDYPDTFDRALLFAPLFGKNTPADRSLFEKFNTMAEGFKRRGDRYVAGAKDWDISATTHEPTESHDYRRFMNYHLWQNYHPELRKGGYTYGNLYAVTTSILKTRASGYAESIKTPITILTATEETVSSIEQQDIMAARLPNVKQVHLKGARHVMWDESPFYRAQAFTQIDRAISESRQRLWSTFISGPPVVATHLRLRS